MNLSELGDGDLIRRAVERRWHDGGAEAFWIVWRRHEGWIAGRVQARRFLAPRGFDRQVFCERVLDRVRENFIRGLQRYRGEGTVRWFLAPIIDHAAIDEYRHQKRRPREVGPRDVLGVDPDGTLADEEALDLIAYRVGMFFPSPHRILEAKDRKEKIRIMLELMAAESKQSSKWPKALRWHYIEGRSQRTVAEELEVDERTVARWLADGREAAKRILRDRFSVTNLGDL